MQLRQYQEMNPHLAYRKMTKLSAKTMVQNSENSCLVTNPSTKQMHEELKTCVLTSTSFKTFAPLMHVHNRAV